MDRANDAAMTDSFRFWTTTFLLALVEFAGASQEAVSGCFSLDLRVADSGTFSEPAMQTEAESGVFSANTKTAFEGTLPVFANHAAAIRPSDLFVCDTGGLWTDADDDGIPDWWTRRYAGTGAELDPNGDDDGDGLTTRQEFIAYTDPTNAASRFIVEIATAAAGASMDRGEAQEGPETTTAKGAISWMTAKGRLYRLYAAETLGEDAWGASPVATLEGTGGLVSVPVDQTSSSGFFFVEGELLPDD